jgi:type I restriction enzyme R subunit
MPAPGEHKTVQARILAYAQEIGWTYVSREEAERRRGYQPQMTQKGTDSEAPENHLRKSAKSAVPKFPDGKSLSLFFDDLLDAKVRTPQRPGLPLLILRAMLTL